MTLFYGWLTSAVRVFPSFGSDAGIDRLEYVQNTQARQIVMQKSSEGLALGRGRGAGASARVNGFPRRSLGASSIGGHCQNFDSGAFSTLKNALAKIAKSPVKQGFVYAIRHMNGVGWHSVLQWVIGACAERTIRIGIVTRLGLFTAPHLNSCMGLLPWRMAV
jgi:hypothetical protein